MKRLVLLARLPPLATVCLTAWLVMACSEPPAVERESPQPEWTQRPASHVGGQACVECHGEQVALWRGSHHDLAMQPVSDETVLADWDDTTFRYGGVTTSFFRRGDEFWVRTDGADGALAEFRVLYTFGVEPLQQYLVEAGRGRLQALPICWDTRGAEDGGQRWFHLYPDEEIDHEDPLHWAGPYLNWNFMCAECHSTALDKGYDLGADRYDTTWNEIDVSCEACHGPASNHLSWARASDREVASADLGRGLLTSLVDRDGGVWKFESSEAAESDSVAANASRSVPRSRNDELEACARCHSRRSPIHPSVEHGRPFLDSYRPVLLEDPLYQADGQILDEVYVYGSFLQSRMHQQGVTCGDCHDPHSLQLRGTTESVCAQCHATAVYDTADHHHHEPGSQGARCVECHMPARRYMQVDPRRDHSFRVPRPDLTLSIGTPNACTECHRDRSAQWAAGAVAEWFPGGRSQEEHYGQAFHAARTSAVDAEPRLSAVARNVELPAIVRATALAELSLLLSPASLTAVEVGLQDERPLVRQAALTALEGADPQTRLRLGFDLLDDGVRAVRLEAARVLSATPRTALTPDQRARLDLAFEDYRAAQLVNGDRPDAHLNIGALLALRGDLTSARQSLETALRLEPGYAIAAINLADLERQEGNDAAGAAVLREALARSPEDARLHHSLGLALIRVGQRQAALGSLARAFDLDDGQARYGYVYGVALHDLGQEEKALDVLDQVHERHPGNQETLSALIGYSRAGGDDAAAVRYARRLLELVPGDPQLRALIAELDG